MKYTRFAEAEMTMRDHLAHDRTILAGERTLLAYLRTWIALMAAGGSIIEIFKENDILRAVGAILIASAFAVLVLGINRFISTRRQVRAVRRAED